MLFIFLRKYCTLYSVNHAYIRMIASVLQFISRRGEVMKNPGLYGVNSHVALAYG